MQTFLPYPNIMMSVGCLDWRRLGKQRLETKQILNALGFTDTPTEGWIHHPATKMWRGYESALAHYGYLCCLQWIERGYEDSMLSEFAVLITDYELPPWFGGPIHASHRSNLLRKDPEYYGQFGWTEPYDMEYVWPIS